MRERGINLVGKPRILIAEDEGIVALDIKRQLEHMGYAVTAIVDSGEAAVRETVETHPDLVLMDIRLRGEIDGIEAAEAIRARLRIPIIYLSALSDGDTVRRAELTEPCGYLTKPIDGDQLQTSVEMALRRCPEGKLPDIRET